MRLRTLILGILCASFGLAAAAPAFADDDWRRHEWREHRREEWREHEWRERSGYYYAAPRVVEAPPVYWAPPTIYYGNPRY